MNTVKISPGVHFRDIVNKLKIDLRDNSLQFLLPDIPSIVQAEEVFIEQGGIWGDRILTFGKLAHIANLDCNQPQSYLSRTGRLLIMEELLQNAAKDFSYFTEINSTSEFSDSLLKVIAELKHSGMDHQGFKKMLSQGWTGINKSKFQDFSGIYSEYSQYLQDNRYIDDIDSLKLLSAYIGKGNFGRIFPETEQIILYGFNDFTDSQIKVIESLSDNGIETLILAYDTDSALSSNSIKVKGFETVTEEVRYCSKQISRLLYTENVNPGGIAVIINSPGDYSNIIHKEFSKAGVSYSQSAALPLVSSIVGRLITDLLLVKISGFKKNHLFNFLRNPYILGLSGDHQKIYRDIALYELNSLNKRVTQGVDRWKGLLADVTNPYSRDFISIVNSIFNLIADKFKSKKISRLNQDLIAVLDKIVYDRIRNNNFLDSLPEYNALVSSFKLVKEYAFLIQKSFKDRSIENLSKYLRLITDLLSEERYSLTGEHKDDQVKVLSMLEARGTSFEYIFLLGAGENRIPNPVRHDPIIKEHERYALNRELEGNILRTTKELIDSEMQLFSSTIRSGKKTIISFVDMDSKGIAVQPAYPVQELYINSSSDIHHDLISPDVLNEAYTESDLFNQIYAAKLFEDDNLKNKLPAEFKFCGHGIKSESIRLRRFAYLSEYEGLLKPDPVLSDKNSFTVTELENYGDCPFKYYASRILNLEFPDETTDEPQPLDLGSLYHRIVYQFFYELSAINDDKLDLTEIPQHEIIKKLQTFLQSLDLDNKFHWLSDHRKKLLINRIKNHVILSFILAESERIRNNNKIGIYPVYFEKDIEYEIDENTLIKGKSDRIDTSSDKALVIDYKFGVVSNRKFSDYRNLQLPLYLLALNSMDYENYGGFYRSVEKPDKQSGMDYKSKNFEDEIDKAFNFACFYIKNIKTGHFPADPNEKEYRYDNSAKEIIKRREAPCIYCEYTDLCRANKRVFRKKVYGE